MTADSTAGSTAGSTQSGASRRKKHRRVVFKGTERFDAEGFFDAEPSNDPDALRERANKSRDDDQRILTELPPHWAKFDAEGRR